MTWTSWVASGLGVRLIIAPFALGDRAIGTAWSDVSAGLMIVVMAGWAVGARTPRGVVTLSSVVAVAGLWIAAASFIVAHLPAPVALWNNVIVGVAVAALGSARAFNPGLRKDTARGGQKNRSSSNRR